MALHMRSGDLNERQKATVLLLLWTALRSATVEIYKRNGAFAVADFQKSLIADAKNADFSGLPLDQQPAVLDFVIELLNGLVTFEGKDPRGG